ncbi:nucleotide disphospho-sugar-binding domain-containing protein [Blastococcus deserti]|uniref:Nucleotide disphospho-sugar-binding domain-containing protein n=1 Tax=Blastococcus deserti TaxID=2259033 RepID=A0ABW4X7K9_9ACTN
MQYLVALWDGGGTVPVEVGVVRRLVARGHRVTVLGDPTLAPDVAAAGAEFRSWTRAPHRTSQALEDDVIKDWECRTPVALLNRLCERIITGPAADYAADVREALSTAPADAVVASGPLLGALVGAESMGLPAVALCANIYSRPAPGIPPFGSGLAPARGPLGRARDRAMNALATALWNRNLPPLNAARTALGLEPLREIWEQWDRAARVLVLTSPTFDLPATLPDNVRYVGPVLDDPVWSEPFEPPAGVEPLVVVGLSSTYMQQAAVLRRIVAALDTLPVRGVVTTGPAVDPAEVPGTAKVHVVRSAPHARLFPDADVVITHAGHGTLIKALAAGVPTLCLPMGRDQGDNVVRAARHGAVIGLKPAARPERIAAAVRQLLDDPSYRRNAQALGAVFRADSASTALVDEVESLERNGAPSGRLAS